MGELFTISGKPASWTSKYGNLTFLAMGREFPVSGINEAGLVVQVLQFHDKYPDDPSIPAVHGFQWIQYQLDMSSTVQEAISNAQVIRPVGRTLQLHYFVCDAADSCAVFEFVDGKLEIYTDSQLPELVTTNSPYPKSLDALAHCRGKSCSQTDDSLMRFIQASKAVEAYDQLGDPVSYAFYALSLARQKYPLTSYNVLFERSPTNQMVYFHPVEGSSLSTIQVSKFDFSCKTPAKVFSFDSESPGDITQNFSDYTSQFQEKFARQPGLALPEQSVLKVIDYPDKKTKCMDN